MSKEITIEMVSEHGEMRLSVGDFSETIDGYWQAGFTALAFGPLPQEVGEKRVYRIEDVTDQTQQDAH